MAGQVVLQNGACLLKIILQTVFDQLPYYYPHNIAIQKYSAQCAQKAQKWKKLITPYILMADI